MMNGLVILIFNKYDMKGCFENPLNNSVFKYGEKIIRMKSNCN
jgi:hypothetical protein